MLRKQMIQALPLLVCFVCFVCFVEPSTYGLRLHVVRAKVELHPQGRVVARVPRSLADGRQDVVVLLRAVPEPFLDAGERGFHDLVLGEHHRLERTRHPAVPVDREPWLGGHRTHVGQDPAVPDDLGPGPVSGGERRLVVHGRGGVLVGDRVALDRV